MLRFRTRRIKIKPSYATHSNLIPLPSIIEQGLTLDEIGSALYEATILNMKRLTSLSCLLIFITSFNVTFAGSFSGQSDYRLLFINHQSPEFDPNQNILNPSEKELAIEKIEEKLAGATLKSLVPLVGTLTKSVTGTETDLLSLVLTTAGSLKNSLAQELSTINVTESDIFPLIQDAYVAPWPSQKRNLFYSAQKISMNAGELVNVLGIQPGSEKFDK